MIILSVVIENLGNLSVDDEKPKLTQDSLRGVTDDR